MPRGARNNEEYTDRELGDRRVSRKALNDVFGVSYIRYKAYSQKVW